MNTKKVNKLALGVIKLIAGIVAVSYTHLTLPTTSRVYLWGVGG